MNTRTQPSDSNSRKFKFQAAERLRFMVQTQQWMPSLADPRAPTPPRPSWTAVVAQSTSLVFFMERCRFWWWGIVEIRKHPCLSKTAVGSTRYQIWLFFQGRRGSWIGAFSRFGRLRAFAIAVLRPSSSNCSRRLYTETIWTLSGGHYFYLSAREQQ